MSFHQHLQNDIDKILFKDLLYQVEMLLDEVTTWLNNSGLKKQVIFLPQQDCWC